MSIKNYNLAIIIKNLTNGDVDIIHDYFKYDKGIQQEILHSRIDKYLQDNQNFAIEYIRENVNY